MRYHAPFVKSDGCLKGGINLNPRMRDPLPARPRERDAPSVPNNPSDRLLIFGDEAGIVILILRIFQVAL